VALQELEIPLFLVNFLAKFGQNLGKTLANLDKLGKILLKFD